MNMGLNTIKRALSNHYVVRGISMRPAFHPGHRLLVASTDECRLTRGVAVIVDVPTGRGTRYLKRVVGLPGEHVRIEDGLLFVDNVHLLEPYLKGMPASLGLGFIDWTLKSDEYFVLGDDRARSTDSRKFGPIKQGQIIGIVWFRYWPLSSWGSTTTGSSEETIIGVK